MSRPVVPIRPAQLILPATVVLLLCAVTPALAQPDHPMAAKRNTPEHGALGPFLWDHIDTYTGNVLHSFADIVLPGNARFNVVVQRTFNTKDGGWRGQRLLR